MVVNRTRLAPACPRGVLAFPLAGKFEEYANAVCVVGSREGCGLFRKRTLYGELFGRVVGSKRRWFV